MSVSDDADPVVIRLCQVCRQERILESGEAGEPEMARCGCGLNPLDALDMEALSTRGP